MNGTDKPANSPFYNANGLLQVWARNGTQLTKAGEIPIGKWCQGVAWSRNSRTLLVQCTAEQEISVIRFTGLDRPVAAEDQLDQDQGRAGRDPHRRTLIG